MTRTRGTGAAHAQRRGEIVEAAVAVAAEHGLPAVSMATVAERARISPGRVQHYFPAKEDMLEAVFHHVNHASSERIHAAVGGDLDAAPARQVLTVVLTELIPHDEASWAHMHIRQSFTALALHHRTIAAELREQYERLHRHDLAGLIRRDQHNNRITSDVEPQHAATTLAALAEGLAYYVLIGVTTTTTARTQLLDAIEDLYRC